MSYKMELTPELSGWYPQEWRDKINIKNTNIFEYRNLQHYKNHISTISSSVDDRRSGCTYSTALDDLLASKPTMMQGDYEIIKNKVKNNLIKKGLISENVYESYKYDVEGDIWDVAKVIAEDPMCCLVPTETYKNYFYELYISAAYPWYVKDEEVRESMAKLLATVELLEREHIYCKITIVSANTSVGKADDGKTNILILLPLFSHREPKSIETMSAVVNERFHRKFSFATFEDTYGSNIYGGYGRPLELPNAITPVNLDEVELASSILKKVIVPCEHRN